MKKITKIKIVKVEDQSFAKLKPLSCNMSKSM